MEPRIPLAGASDCNFGIAAVAAAVATLRQLSHSAGGQSNARQATITQAKKMQPYDLKSMSVDELWSLHKIVASLLAQKISVEKTRLDQRLRELGQSSANSAKEMSQARRPYPQVFPKYRNPAQPSETWAGRGKQPRWLTAQLRSGKKIDDFRIQQSPDRPGGAAHNGRPNKKTARRRSA